VVSNFHDGRGHELPAAADEFDVALHIMQPGDAGFFWAAPDHLTAAEREALKGQLGAADAQRSVEALVEILAAQVLAVSDRDEGVGRGLMINVLPRAALGDPGEISVVASGPIADSQTFLYVPPSGDTTVQLGPVARCGGGIMSDFRSEPIR
jgi:hypothetical protein